MNFNRTSLVLVALLAAGCGGGGSGDAYSDGGGASSAPPPAPMPAPEPAAVAFAPFVKAQLAQTSHTSEPAEVNDQQWEFDENETAFDDVLQ